MKMRKIKKFKNLDGDKTEWSKVDISDIHLDILVNVQPQTIFMKESGLYSLMLRSKKSEVKQLNKGVTSKVLPSILKTEAYISLQISQNQLTEFICLLQKKDKQLSKKKINN